MTIHPSSGGKKDLRRLPHVYSKVLELPLPADADVGVFEGPDAFHFVVVAAGAVGAGEVRVRTVRIHPGVVKVVVQAVGAGGGGEEGGEMELDRWRSRLPEASCPAMAAAGYVNGQLVVTVPKERGGDGQVWGCCKGGGKISGKLVAVQ